MDAQEELVDVNEFARMANVTVSAVRRWTANGIGPRAIRPPGTRIVRFRRREIQQWLAPEPAEQEPAEQERVR